MAYKDVKISKALSYFLRHGGLKEGLKFREDGYTSLEQLLKNKSFASLNADISDISRIVNSNDKKRFQLLKDDEDGQFYIRAVQGHSIDFKNIGYKKIEKVGDHGVYKAVHGTYRNVIEKIKKEGLSKMSRTHIHFALGEPNDNNVISGMRSSSQVYVYLDIQKCLDDGIEILISENGVVLTNGLNGVLPPKYFQKVVDIKDRKKRLKNS